MTSSRSDATPGPGERGGASPRRAGEGVPVRRIRRRRSTQARHAAAPVQQPVRAKSTQQPGRTEPTPRRFPDAAPEPAAHTSPAPATEANAGLSLRVGFIPGVEPDVFAKRWSQARDRVRLELVPVEAREQEDAVADGRLDMVFARLPFDDARTGEVFAVPLWEERAVAVMSTESELSVADELTPEDLAGEHEFAAQETGDEKSRVEIVASGIGYTCMPMSLARSHHRKDVTYRPLAEAEPTVIALVWPRVADDPVRQEFVAVVRGRTARSSRGSR